MHAHNIDISILLPSRGRLKKLKGFIESVKLNTHQINKIEIVIRIDNDDKVNYNRLIDKYNFCKFIKGKSVSMGKLNQDCIKQAVGKIIFFSNDDVIFRTNKWDVILKDKIKSVRDNFFLMYPNDLYKRKKLSTFPIVLRKTLVENPFLIPNCYQGSFLDLHIMDIFKQYKKGKNIFYLENIICEHQHFRIDKTKFDDTYKRRQRFGDDHMFIKTAPKRKLFIEYLYQQKKFIEFKHPNNGVFMDLILGYSDIKWRIKIFLYMYSRQCYKSFLGIFK